MQYPPARICKKLAEFNADLRLAWDGELGKFGLVQLFSRRRAATTYREEWKRRGPIFGVNGKTKRDFDTVTKVPIYIIDVESDDVFSGKIIPLVKEWARPIVARVYESAIAKGRQIESDHQARVDHMAGELYKKGQADGGGAPVVAKKHATYSPAYIAKKEGRLKDLTKSVLPPEPEGGWEKHLKADQGRHDSLGSVK